MTTPARRGPRVRLKPLEYVQRFGPPTHQCRGCSHRKPYEHDAGGRLDRAVLADVAARANWAPASWGEGAWPSVPKIARRTGYCDRSVQYSLRRLVASGFLELVERPGRSSLMRIVRHLEPIGSVDTEPEIVDDVGDNRAPGHESTGPCQVAPESATVAPDPGTQPPDHPPVAPLLGLGESDGAVAPAQRGAPMAPPGDPPSATAPPAAAGARSEPHRRMRRPAERAEPAPPSYDDVAAALSATQRPEDASPRLSRQTARRTRHCNDCGAQPGESCRGRDGRPRKANHAARRVPDVYGPAARAGLWRPPRSPDEPAF